MYNYETLPLLKYKCLRDELTHVFAIFCVIYRTVPHFTLLVPHYVYDS